MMGSTTRNLEALEVSIGTTRGVSRLVPAGRMSVCESGMNAPGERAEMAMYGARSCLIGESLMRQEDIAGATRTLRANPLLPAGGM